MLKETIRFSVAPDDSLHQFKTIEAESLNDIADVITQMNWSHGTFKESHRTKANFLEAEIIGLDIDSGCSLAEAYELFTDYKHIIATSKSHGKEKNGVICDRFRVILFLDKPISNAETFEATWRGLEAKFPFLDSQARDCSRFFYPSPEVLSIEEEGQLVEVLTPVIKPKPVVNRTFDKDQRGKLAASTMKFLVFGAEPGSWNHSLFKAAKDWQEQGYEQQDFINRAEMIEGHLDEGSLSTIDSAYKNEPRYEPRALNATEVNSVRPEANLESLIVTPWELGQETMRYLGNKDVVKGMPTGLPGLDQMLGGGKRLGEVTALVAEGKVGKNALYHYLMNLWIREGIKMGYASRELDPATEVIPDLLSMQFQESARLTDLTAAAETKYVEAMKSWPLYFAKGRGYFKMESLVQWVSDLKAQGVDYFFFDHLHWMLDDPEDYKAASLLSRMLSDVAKNQNIHIDVIIQPKVLMDGQKLSLNSMKGGSAIGQNINNLLTLERVPEQKFVSKLTLKVARSRLAAPGHIYLKYDPTTLGFDEGELEESEQEPSNPLSNVFSIPSWDKKGIL